MSAELKITRPLIRYHGGKFRLAPWLISHFPAHRTYVEPFGGGGSVLLLKRRTYCEVYNDLSFEVVNLFRVMQDLESAAELKRRLFYTPFARLELEVSREVTTDPVERARRLLIRAFMGFGSAAHNIDFKTGFRSKSQRSGTTPAHDWLNYPDCLDAIVARLRGVVIENRPALELLELFDAPDALFYLDPPYPRSTRYLGENTECYEFEMSDDQHRELASALSTVKGSVIISGYACDLYDLELFSDWTRVQRDVAGNGGKGGVARTEVLWINESATRARAQRGLFD